MNDLIAGRYQVMDFLGSAAFSRAVQALDIKTNTLCCLKIVKVWLGEREGSQEGQVSGEGSCGVWGKQKMGMRGPGWMQLIFAAT